MDVHFVPIADIYFFAKQNPRRFG
jgi:hypothetical protein